MVTRPDPVELVGVSIRFLVEAVSVALFLAMIATFAAIWSGA
jgi:hypothetical protein